MKKEVSGRWSPYDEANFLSKLFFAWLTPLFIKSYKSPLTEEEIFNISFFDSSNFLTQKFKLKWDEEVQKEQPNLARVIISIMWRKYLLFGAILFVENCFNLVQPFLIWKLLISVRNIEDNLKCSIIYSSLLIILVALIIILRNPYYFHTLRMGMQVKVGISGLIYQKILRLNQKALSKTDTGQIINLLSNDVQRFELGFAHLHYIWIGPIITILSVGLLYVFSKEGGLASIIVFLLIIPLQIALGSFYNKLRKKVSVLTDERIKMVSELINGIRVIKMYCWEPMFLKVIGELRRKTLLYGIVRKLSKSFWVALRFSGGRFIMMALLITISLCRINTSSVIIWVTVILINQIRAAIIDRFSIGITNYLDMRISVSRIQTFLTLPELINEREGKSSLSLPIKLNNLDESEFDIIFKNVNASWNMDNLSEMTLTDISFSLKSPQICAVIGEVGSGKSSLLMTLLGELPLSSGEIYLKGNVTYTSQQPWVFSGSIQDNVLFNNPLHKDKLGEIISATTLDQDINIMPQGLDTKVGERGVSLSGGQKSRVSLARAAYASSDIILLDDPLAAVDSEVGHRIFFDCLRKQFKDKLVILVTHQLHLLKHVDQILLLKDGHLLASGTLSEIKSLGFDLHTMLKKEILNDTLSKQIIHDSAYIHPREKIIETINKNSSNMHLKGLTHEDIPLLMSVSSDRNSALNFNLNKEKDELEKLEIFSFGTVGFHIYWTYFTSGCSIVVTLLVMLLYIFTMFLYIFCDLWLLWWTQEMDKRNLSDPNFYINDGNYQLGLILLTLGNFIFALLSVAFLFMICISSSKVLHTKMLNSILNSPMSFFDKTPAGRILNRFSKDIGIIDDLMPITIQDLIITSYLVVFGLGLSMFKNYWCSLIIAPLFVVFWMIRKSYLNVARTIKRIEATTRSPLFDHVSTTLQGLTTIRAFKSQKRFINNFYNKQDRHSKAFFLYISSSRWFAFRLDEICLIFIAGVTYSCLALLFYKKLHPSDFGLILTYIIGFIGLTQWAVRQSTEVENQMISVERIYEYINLPSEKIIINEKNNKDIINWPQTGKIHFENVNLFYDDSNLLTLINVNLNINDKEKIGIVGRTGAGKSSLISTLFRLVELPPNCGRILVDDCDISSISLNLLRNSIAVIPQDPVLFMGNIRRNLDPFSNFDDNLLWKVLDTVELKDTINRLSDKLYSSVSEGGSNLSVGQRQLLCMARALLKKTRIIVLDEATANVDPKTDRLIQRTLKTTFDQCTVLTIAHRLNTVIDSDKILVMSEGKVEEFDHAYKLLTDHPHGIFTQLIKQTGPEEVRLREEAKLSYYSKRL